MATPQKPSWQHLHRQMGALVARGLPSLFASDARRFERLSMQLDGLLIDLSKHFLDGDSVRALAELGQTLDIPGRIDALMSGEHVNTTEDRPALHTALRLPAQASLSVNGEDIVAEVQGALGKMEGCVERLRLGNWHGCTGEPLDTLVYLGIGGSQLGPELGCAALQHLQSSSVTCHFVANIDPSSLAPLLARLNPATTLFAVASKTFTTQETLKNALAARHWLLSRTSGQEKRLGRHFLAITAAPDKAAAFGVPEAHILPFWSWVGGRYSLWSPIGFPIALQIGMQGFKELLAGAHAVDRHLAETPLASNVPFLLAGLDVCYRSVLNVHSLGVVPYETGLALLPAYLQQLGMESNGKRCGRDGHTVATPTGGVIWGATGTNGQHAFFQLLHQGTDVIPVDFIVGARSVAPLADHHELLVVNCLAQSQALMQGRTLDEVRRELLDQGSDALAAERLAPHKVCPGNRPSTTVMYDSLTPRLLGSLLALYEHRIFVQALLWDINPFDQWGVELGKQLANHLLASLDKSSPEEMLDASTRGLLEHYRRRRA